MGAAGLDHAPASSGPLLQAGQALADGAALDLDHGAAVGVAWLVGRQPLKTS